MELDPNFNPSYFPWEQRMCLCPDGDFSLALRSGKSSVVTGVVDSINKGSIKLNSGEELSPDVIVTATGLKMQFAGGMELNVDGKQFIVSEKYMWKKVMIQDLPNVGVAVGYVDASWTLVADATALLISRLLRQMLAEKTTVLVPYLNEAEATNMKPVPYLKLQSIYVQKGKDAMPKAGSGPKWRGRSTYFNDSWQAKFGDIRTGLVTLRGNSSAYLIRRQGLGGIYKQVDRWVTDW